MASIQAFYKMYCLVRFMHACMSRIPCDLSIEKNKCRTWNFFEVQLISKVLYTYCRLSAMSPISQLGIKGKTDMQGMRIFVLLTFLTADSYFNSFTITQPKLNLFA
jgi:hypothetical protein